MKEEYVDGASDALSAEAMRILREHLCEGGQANMESLEQRYGKYGEWFPLISDGTEPQPSSAWQELRNKLAHGRDPIIRALVRERAIASMDGKPVVRAGPPPFAELLITTMTPKRRREAILGDLDERFASDCRKFGECRAKNRYWGYVLSSLIPLAWQATKKLRVFALFEVARRALGF